MPKTNHNNQRQPAVYYEDVINQLIRMNNRTLSYGQMADELNALGILTPTGMQWEATKIKGLLQKLRNYKTTPSYIAQHLLELIFQNKLTLNQSLPLFQSNRHGIK